jgi:chemotaxis methyl-accepting protein methylase
LVRYLEQVVHHSCPAGSIDLILGGNLVFSCFETAIQVAIARRLAERLVAGGMLLLGIHKSLQESIPVLA